MLLRLDGGRRGRTEERQSADLLRGGGPDGQGELQEGYGRRREGDEDGGGGCPSPRPVMERRWPGKPRSLSTPGPLSSHGSAGPGVRRALLCPESAARGQDQGQ
ncbi:MAG: hypothetical protein MZU84_05945 [Sphingobacterium sp.]|nr:hypothetical protein [Sphingobacterium sp.]